MKIMPKQIFGLSTIALVLTSSLGTTMFLNGNHNIQNTNSVSPASRFNPIVRIEKNDGGYRIATDRAEMARFAQNFRMDAEFVYVSTVIGDAVSSGLSADWVRTQVGKALSRFDSDLFDISRLYKRDGNFYLPYGSKAIDYPFLLRFCPAGQPAENPAGAPSFVIGGARVFIEDPIREADELDQNLSELNIRTERRQPVVKRQIFSGKRRSVVYLNELEFGFIVKDTNLAAIKSAVTNNHRSVHGERGIYVDLPEPISVSGRRYVKVYIKGAKFDETKQIGRQETSSMIGDEMDPLVVDSKDDIVRPGPVAVPDGGMLYRKAKAEFKNHYLMFHNDFLTKNSIYVAAPIGYGIFPDAPLFSGEKMGFVILGIDDEMPVGTKSKPVSVSTLGATLRHLHDAGFTHPNLYFGNVSGHDKKVYVQDLDLSEYVSPGRSFIARMVMSEIRDIFYFYMKNVYYRLSSLRYDSPARTKEDEARRVDAEAAGRRSMQEFVDAYFHDCKTRLRDYLSHNGIIKPMESIAAGMLGEKKEVSLEDVDASGKSFIMLLRHNFIQKRGYPSGKTVFAEVKKPAEGYVQDEVEAGQATRFIDLLKVAAKLAREQNKAIVIGMDLSWIPEEQLRAIQPVLNSIKDLSRRGPFLNIVIVREKGVKLADEVLKESKKKDVDPSRVIILANEATAFGEMMTSLRGTEIEDKLLLVGVSPKNISKKSYIRIFEMLGMALKIAENGYGAARSPFIDIMPDPNNRKIMHFIPRSEPLDNSKLENIYYLQSLASKST
jgi:hypothetical protein